MVKKTGGEMVKAGFYWNAKDWDAKIAPPQGFTLPGDSTTSYYKLPLLALLVIAPLMGAAYAFFLPFVGFAMLTMFLAGRVGRMFRPTPPVAGQAEQGRKAA